MGNQHTVLTEQGKVLKWFNMRFEALMP